MGFDELERADLAFFFRAPSLDAQFPAERLLPTFEETLAGLGLQNGAPGNVILDAEPRPKKSPRAFCAPVRVPEEVYLVLTRIGGREDYETLMHEAGHAEHFSHVDPALPVEHRYLGDNSVTEGFAFLFQHLTRGSRLARAPARHRRSRADRRAGARLEARLPAALLREARLRARASGREPG